MERFAPTSLPILLVGATGTGKELFARHIHERSKRIGELVDLNCGALPQEMVESLLFGHRRGAFTGAVESVTGHIERSHRGTLFLDEVLDLSPSAQVKLLRVLDTAEVQPLGETRKHFVDLRVIAAAQDNAATLVNSGHFRRDLYQRLAGIVIEIPTLEKRRSDVLLLANYFALEQHQRLEAGTEPILREYPWPGNVRELRLVIQRAGCLVENGTLPASAIAEAIKLGSPACVLTPDGHELLHLLKSLEWNVRAAATSLGISRSTFYDRLHDAGISLRTLKPSKNGNLADKRSHSS